jgi:probable F420-dependent oxidoreductase
LQHAVTLPFWLDRPAAEAIEIARSADQLGYVELWVGEMATFDAFALAGAIARETTRITLVVGPLAVAVRDPASLALGVSSVAELAGRPAHLALGASNPLIVEGWHGRPWQPIVRRMRETVAALRPAFAGERVQFRGEEVRCEGFRLHGELHPTELTIAAFGPQMIRAAAELADRVVLNLVSPAQVAAIREDLERAAGGAGRAAPPLTVWVPAALEPGAATMRQLAAQLAAYVGAPGYGEMFAAGGFDAVVALARSGAGRREVADRIPAELVEMVCVLGDAGAIRSGLDAYEAAGAETVSLAPATAEDPGGHRTLAVVKSF